MRARLRTGDVRAFGDEGGELPHGLDECGVVAGAGEVHGGFEVGGQGGVTQGGEGFADADLDCVEAGFAVHYGGFDVRVGVDLGAPSGAGGFVLRGRGFRCGDHLLRVKVDELLSLVLREAKVLEDRGGGFEGLGVDGVAFGRSEVGVGFGDLRFGFGLRRRCRRRGSIRRWSRGRGRRRRRCYLGGLQNLPRRAAGQGVVRHRGRC